MAVEGFTFFSSYCEALDELTMEERGEFITAICDYMFKDAEPDFDSMSKAARIAFKAQRTHINRSIAASSNAKRAKRSKREQTLAKSSEIEQTLANASEAEASSSSSSSTSSSTKRSNEKPDYSSGRQRVIDHLNDATGKSFKASSALAVKHLNARFNEGYTVGDCIKVIDNMAAEWGGDPKMERFLRPETLFGSKFDGYLNAGGKAKPPPGWAEFGDWDDSAVAMGWNDG